MSGTGTNYQDLLPLPEKTNAITDPDKEEKAHELAEGETASHAIAIGAAGEHDEKGLAQQEHDAEVSDLGWNEPKQKIPAPLVGGMDNEELWLLVRRFNKQLYHVKETTKPVPGNLDLNIADEDEFSPDKLRSTLERLYMTVGIGMMGFGKHIMRLRSWREKRRTAVFCAAYFIAWILDLIMPLITTTLIVLIAYPPSRAFLFPPAPLALVDSKTGGVQKPPAGVLGSHDSATGAPENFKGEAVEQEATNFVNGVAQVALSSASGKHPMNDSDTEQGGPGGSIPDPSSMAMSASDARVAAQGASPDVKKDKTKQPMEAAIWEKMRPLMHGLQDFADGWERFANALSPTSPFPQETPRLRLAAVVIPLLAVSLVVTSYMYMKGVMFGVGFGFFGDPIIWRSLDFLNKNYPNWQKLLELRNTLLKGVPTNAQLTITLLRLGEANKSPLPPPPLITAPPPEQAAHLTEDDLNSTGADAPLGASQQEIEADAIKHDPSAKTQITSGDVAAGQSSSHGKSGNKILGAIKGGVKASIETALGADRIKATAGSSAAKNRIGILPNPNAKDNNTGPIDFKARFNGKKGYVFISTKATIPCVSFTTDHSVEKIGSQDRDDLHPQWSIAVSDLKDLKKLGGLGWKAKLVVAWALEREIADGLELIDRQGTKRKLTAMTMRDELFNRLVAMGGQKWESW